MKLNLKNPIVFFDLETTGTNINTDRIVEICYLKVYPNGNEEAKTLRINPEMHIPEASSAVHGIYDADVADCPTFKEVAKNIARDIEGCDLAGFNSNRFDIPVLAEEFLRAGVDIDMTKRKFVDVQVIFHKMEQRTLSAAYKFYCEKNLEDAHTAEADTRATYEVLKAQLDRYDELQNDIAFLADYSSYSKNVDFAGRMVYDDNGVEVFNFGKYKGMSVAEVLKKDPGYYSWILNSDFTLNTKAVLTKIRLRDNIQLNPNQYIIKIKGIQVTEGEILFDHYMAMNPGYVEEEITGIPTFEPSFHLPAIWITESQRERAESLGYTVVDPPSIIATHLTEVIRNHIAELLTRQDVQNLVNNLKESNPVLVDELIPKLLGLGEVQKVLQNLLSEGISIRDLLTIFETLADHAAVTRDTDVLTEYVRQSLKRAISNKFFPANETTSVITLDPKIEQEIMSSVKQTEQGAYLTLDPERTKAIMASLEQEAAKLENMGKTPIVITSPIVRMYFKKLTEDYFKDLIVVSYNEVESNIELQSVGMVTA